MLMKGSIQTKSFHGEQLKACVTDVNTEPINYESLCGRCLYLPLSDPLIFSPGKCCEAQRTARSLWGGRVDRQEPPPPPLTPRQTVTSLQQPRSKTPQSAEEPPIPFFQYRFIFDPEKKKERPKNQSTLCGFQRRRLGVHQIHIWCGRTVSNALLRTSHDPRQHNVNNIKDLLYSSTAAALVRCTQGVLFKELQHFVYDTGIDKGVQVFGFPRPNRPKWKNSKLNVELLSRLQYMTHIIC